MDTVASQSPALPPNPSSSARNSGNRGRPWRGRGRGRGRPPTRRYNHNRASAADGQESEAGVASGERQSRDHTVEKRRRGKNDSQGKKPGGDRATTPLPQVSAAGTELSERLANQMNRGKIECVVCLGPIRRDHRIWSCEVCYVITHLKCVRKWGNQCEPGEEEGDQKQEVKCPSCRAPAGQLSSIVFRCYCRRRRNPQLEPGILPGSCGELCLKPRGAPGSDCPHRCQALCHPGPCAPCMVQAPPMPCYCGSEKISRRCGEEIQLNGLSCGRVCGQRHWNCDHQCENTCHLPGDEGECEVSVDVTCHCGKNSASLPCAVSSVGFACGEPCGKKLSCGNHVCQQSCHEGECAPCKTSPEIVTHCSCGKTLLTIAQRFARTSCLDPVPGCGGTCEGPLGCIGNHKCAKDCGHEGECGPCEETVTVECRCGTTTVRVSCGEDFDKLRSKLICDKKCNERLLCKRHNCQRVCCPFKRRKGTLRPDVISGDIIWNDATEVGRLRGMSNAERRRLGHHCEKTCEKELGCGLHACDLICGHTGDCPPCGLLRRTPLFCACGSESIPPPVRCGTEPPVCRKPCSKVRECGHPCPRECHPGECDPCVELLSVPCVGGHNERFHVPCYLGRKGKKCSRSCGKPLLCGIHACRKSCHDGAPQECEISTTEGCLQICGLARKQCEHSCTSPCHPGRLCPDMPCQEVIVVSCPCGRRQETSKCLRGGMGGAAEKNDSVRLKCDDACAGQSRIRAFASAIGRDARAGEGREAGTEVETQTKYPESLLQFAEREPGILAYFEEELGHIAQGRTRKYTFENIPQLHRATMHKLAEFYCLETESVGRSPHRHTVVRHAGVGVKPVLPKPLLSEAWLMRDREKRRIRQLESGKTLIIHVASTTKHPATAKIEQRVERELRSHTGAFRITGRSTMSSNLIGVSVDFSTQERAALAKTALLSRPGVTVEKPNVKPLNEGSSSQSNAPTEVSNQSWDDGVTEYSSHGTLQGILREASSVAIDENVPDSWDD